jgi:Na+/H+ antiporter NhaA
LSAARTRAGPDQTVLRRRELLQQLADPLREFLKAETGSAGLLLGVALVALVWANSPLSDSYEALWSTELSLRLGGGELTMDLRHWGMDGLMFGFFLVIGLEVRRELAMGELTDRRMVALPAVAALGGMIVPAALYLLLAPRDAASGWGIVIATDTAFMLGALALVGPARRTPLRVFLLTLSIFDDLVAVSVIALFYSEGIRWLPLGLAAACLLGIAVLGRLGAWRASPYVFLGAGLWLATAEAGVHPTIAGLAMGLAISAYPPRREEVERAAALARAFQQSPVPPLARSATLGVARALSPNERIQAALHPWSSYVIVPLFALANAGVDLRGGAIGEALSSPVTWSVVAGLVGGKLIGVGGSALAGARLGIGRLPRGVGPGHVLGGAALSGIGFTVSLLIIELGLESAALREQAKIGVLAASVLAVVTGCLVFRLAAALTGEPAGPPMRLDPPVDPARDHIRGPVGAPLTLVEYADFECPFCGSATGMVDEVRRRVGDRLRYVFRHLPLTDVHPHAELAAQASEAAGAQDRFWEFHDILFEHQDELEVEDLLGYAGDLELDVERFARELEDGVHSARVREDVASAEASGARGTPTFFVGDRRHVGPYDAATLVAELEASCSETPRAGTIPGQGDSAARRRETPPGRTARSGP